MVLKATSKVKIAPMASVMGTKKRMVSSWGVLGPAKHVGPGQEGCFRRGIGIETGLSYANIAAEVGLSRGTVQQLVERGRRRRCARG
ncbi:sigma factor-like helix-turn-helix DNA-binding protein [Nocardiopsis sp. NPDC058631]|uniref:sigma factor-like helix-turn-helix DNA-binding protein n=1 Tax=Nocardiopsis sp. NPDC058631 TaxID=3346566 RepID=UPI0036465A4D